MQVAALQTELVKQGLPKTGLKYELQDRLRDHLFPKAPTVAKPPAAIAKPAAAKTDIQSVPLTVQLNGNKYVLSLPNNKTIDGLLEHIRTYLK